MPIPIIPLDTQYPATWVSVSGGVPVSGIEDTVDAASALRAIVGNDRVNYFNMQRAEGDLFKRDLILHKQIIRIIDYLSTRTGVGIASPDIVIMPQTWVTIGRMRLDSTNCPSGAWLVGVQARYLAAGVFPATGTPSASDCSLVIADTAGAVTATISATATPTGSIFLVTDTTTRSSTTLAANGPSKEYEFRLRNTHATASIIASATAIWQAIRS